jgi:hypothetical protein
MANWYGASRSNYVEIEDLGGLQDSLARFGGVHIHEKDGKYCLLADETEDGGWPSFALDNDDLLFLFEDHVMPFVKEGEVLVIQQAGHEKLRYVSGYAAAFVRRGHDIDYCDVGINDIYQKAAGEFNVDIGDITRAEY